jgi:hypothetical protein
MVRGMGNIIRFMLFRGLGGRFALALAAIGFLRSRRRSSAARITPPRR